MNRIKKLFSSIMIVPVPAELKGQLDDIQLKNSLYRISALALIVLFVKSVNAFFYFIRNDHFKIEVLFNLRNNIEFAIIVLFVLVVAFFGKSAKKNVLWLACYLYVGLSYVLYSFDMRSVELESVLQVPVTFSIVFILYTLVPDFKPRIFISFAVLYFLAAIGVISVTLIRNNMLVRDSFALHSFILNIFIIILFAKILHYNNIVKTFVNTFEINKLNENLVTANKKIEKQKEELQNYNDNLEGMVHEKTRTIIELKNAIMETIADLVERRDHTTGGHVGRTSRLLKIVIDEMIAKGLYREQTESWNVDQMIMSAQLHDVGKIAIDDSILRKPGKLDYDEFETMKKHTVLGGEIIKEIQKKTEESEYLENAYIFAVYHHEKWDGSGYPYGISGEDIPLSARLMAIIDVYDALVSERPYKKAFTHEEAIKIIQDGKGTHFDPLLTELFLSVSDRLIVQESQG